jgi:hypothetical protein
MMYLKFPSSEPEAYLPMLLYLPWALRYDLLDFGIVELVHRFGCYPRASVARMRFSRSLGSEPYPLSGFNTPIKMAGEAGVEPATDRLTADCSTSELLASMVALVRFELTL